jgi:serine/threonine protein kinase
MSREHHRNALPESFQLEEYRVDSVLGHGGFGITYLAKDTNLEQWVAIKEYLPNDLAVREGLSTVYAKSTTDEVAFDYGLERFILEARTLAQFHHPNIVRVIRYFKANRTAYMVMEYIDGESLSAHIKRQPLNEEELFDLVLPLLDGLEKVHNAGFLHRDIKPANIILRPDSSPVLLDFGAARLAIGQRTTDLTSIVTPGYAPFEQYDSKSPQGPWTDIYSLGAVMYCAITGKAPPDVIGRYKRDNMLRAEEIGAGKYRLQILRAIDWALALDDEARPRSIPEWREALLAEPLEVLPSKLHKTFPNQRSYRWFSIGMLILALGVPSIYAMYLEIKTPGTLKTALAEWFIPDINEQEVRELIGRFFAAYEHANIDELLALYSETVDYYNFGKVDKSTVKGDKISYFNRWPQVHFELAGKIDFSPAPNGGQKVTFDLLFNTNNPHARESESRPKKGKARHEWILKREGSTLKIIMERQKVYYRHEKTD